MAVTGGGGEDRVRRATDRRAERGAAARAGCRVPAAARAPMDWWPDRDGRHRPTISEHRRALARWRTPGAPSPSGPPPQEAPGRARAAQDRPVSAAASPRGPIDRSTALESYSAALRVGVLQNGFDPGHQQLAVSDGVG